MKIQSKKTLNDDIESFFFLTKSKHAKIVV